MGVLQRDGLKKSEQEAFWRDVFQRMKEQAPHPLWYPQRYEMHWRLWNGGTARVLLWGDPEYARRFAESTRLYDGDGFELNEPLCTKTEAEPHDAPPFDLLTPTHRYYEYEFERYWHFFEVNGFTGADGWKLVYYMECDNARRTFKLPREEEIRGLSIVLNTHYAKATKAELYDDEDPQPVVLVTKPDNSRQDFDLAPRKARSLTINLAQFDEEKKTTGIDNLWIRVTRSPAWHERVKPLLNIGGLVKYPMGKGGLVLNQLLAKTSEAVPVNARKKQPTHPTAALFKYVVHDADGDRGSRYGSPALLAITAATKAE